MLSRLCRAVFWLYVVTATLALLLVPVSELGLFGIERTPLSGVFAVLLAQPWLSFLPDAAAGNSIVWNMALVG